MSIVPLLKKVDILNSLSESQLEKVAEVWREQICNVDDIIFKEDDKSSELYLIQDGLVEITLSVPEPGTEQSIITLGKGQTFGEFALLDEGPRTASARCIVDGTRLWVAKRVDFISLCEKDTSIGFTIMRNIAADLSFKLRLINLTEKSLVRHPGR